MPHVTFIHGIANKVSADDLLANWEFELSQGGLDLATEGVTTSMVYWADVMYAKPLASGTNFESVDEGLGTDNIDEDMGWTDSLSGKEKEVVGSLREKLGFDQKSPEDDQYSPSATANNVENESLPFEAIPLPWFIKRRVMKVLLKDVHHYLFNTKFSPRPNEEFQVQDHIRRLFVDQLKKDAENNSGSHVVVSHSMGTVISYDCLKNVPECPAIDAYMTVGSPLGISEVHDNFQPAYNKRDAFPSEKVQGNWINVFDHLDPVAFDSHIANDYQKNGQEVLTDQSVKNTGKWRHSSYKYYGQEILCNHLRGLLGL